FLRSEVISRPPLQHLTRERSQAMHHTMRRQNNQPRSIHINERHHYEIVGSKARTTGPEQAIFRWSLAGNPAHRSCRRHCAPLVAISESRFIAMVSVRNDEPFVTHLAANKLNHTGIGLPHLVQ